MIGYALLECSFLIPIRRDALLSDGRLQSRRAWEWLDDEMWKRFEAATQAPGLHVGFYKDPDTGQRVSDKSRKYLIALPASRLDDLRMLLAEACVRFQQKCIYLSVAGDVEFIERSTP